MATGQFEGSDEQMAFRRVKSKSETRIPKEREEKIRGREKRKEVERGMRRAGWR
jgi:hypothetical protein